MDSWLFVTLHITATRRLSSYFLMLVPRWMMGRTGMTLKKYWNGPASLDASQKNGSSKFVIFFWMLKETPTRGKIKTLSRGIYPCRNSALRLQLNRSSAQSCSGSGSSHLKSQYSPLSQQPTKHHPQTLPKTKSPYPIPQRRSFTASNLFSPLAPYPPGIPEYRNSSVLSSNLTYLSHRSSQPNPNHRPPLHQSRS